MARRGRKNVGIIGLGIIGSRVAENLRLKGFHVFVWNRSPRPVPNFVGAPVELAEMCDCIQIFVSDDEALLDVVKRLAPALAPRHIVIAHSTVAPHSMLAAAEVVEKRGARFIEAPFTGSKTAAENGEMVYYVAGDGDAIQEARPVLEANSKEIIEIGQIGQATVIKVATNILTAAIVQAAAEGMALTKDSGVSLEKFAAAIKSNASNSGTLSMKLPKMIDGNFEPHFSVKHMLKDMQIANRLGLANHLELSVTGVTRDRLLEQAQRGFADEDYSVLARKYLHDARLAGQEEANLELFNQTSNGPSAPSETPETTAAASNPEGVPPVTEAPSQESPPAELDASKIGEPPPESNNPSPAPEVTSQSESQKLDTGSTPDASAAQVEGSPAVEENPRRGFFDRLLGRGSEA